MKMKGLRVVSSMNIVQNGQELAIIGSLAIIKGDKINSFPLFPIFSQGSSDRNVFDMVD